MMTNSGKMPAAAILQYAAWFGFVTGVVEGLLLYLLRSRELLRGQISFLGASWDVVWITPLFDVLLYLLVGALLAVLARFIAGKLARRLIFLTFCFLLTFAWISTYLEGRISAVATIILAAGIAYQLSSVLREREQRFSPFVRKSLKVFILAWIALVVVIQGGYWLQERISTGKLPADRLSMQAYRPLDGQFRAPDTSL
jgi:hypothetical protein